MTHAQYIQYFKELAEQHYLILHDDDTRRSFYRANIEELLDGLKDAKLSFPCLVLDSQSGQVSGQSGFFDNPWDNTPGAFTILKKVKQSDFDDENTVLDATKQIGFDIIARMKLDFTKKVTRDDGSIKLYYFNPSSVRYYKVGPLNDQEFGYRFEFLIGSPMEVGLGYVADRWV